MKNIDWKVLFRVILITVLKLAAIAAGTAAVGFVLIYFPPIAILIMFCMIIVGFYIYVEYKNQMWDKKNGYRK